MPRLTLLGLLEAEMRLERTSALARIGEKLQRALDEMHTLEAQHARLPPGEPRRLVAQKHATARKTAEEQRFYLVVQREALGMTDQKIIDEIYPMPPPLRD